MQTAIFIDVQPVSSASLQFAARPTSSRRHPSGDALPGTGDYSA